MNTTQDDQGFDVFIEKLNQLPTGFSIRFIQNKEKDLTVVLRDGYPVFWHEDMDLVWKFAISEQPNEPNPVFTLRFSHTVASAFPELEGIPIQRIMENLGYIVLDIHPDQAMASSFVTVDKIIEPLPHYLTSVGKAN